MFLLLLAFLANKSPSLYVESLIATEFTPDMEEHFAHEIFVKINETCNQVRAFANIVNEAIAEIQIRCEIIIKIAAVLNDINIFDFRDVRHYITLSMLA
jgi:hypothetical protein